VHSYLCRCTSLHCETGTEHILIEKVGLECDFFEVLFELIQNYFLSIELIHMPLSLDDESFEFILLHSFVPLVLPEPLHVCGWQQLKHNPGLFGIWLGVDYYFICRNVEVKRLVFPQKMVFLESGLKFAS